MGDYLKLFETHTEYETYSEGEMILPNVSYCEDNNCVHYNPIPYDYSQDYFTIEALEDNVDITYGGGVGSYSVSASTDNGETWESESSYFTIRLNTGEKLLLKGNNTMYYDYEGEANINSSGQHIIYGNILSLVYGDNFRNYTELPSSGSEEIFSRFLKRDLGLVSAENLILAENTITYCYANLFYGCTSLVKGPKLPATTLAQGCYGSMFSGCTSLTTAPQLPATTLANQCYQYMFNGCTSLTTAPELPATTLEQSCYYTMFNGCTNLVNIPLTLPATTLAVSCYASMFQGCTSLTTAPVLPATTLSNGCYSQMFFGCTSLETAPELPATTLVNYCYNGMFRNCSLLNSVKCLATDISANLCTNDWLNNVAATGTFTKAASMSSWTTGTSGVPNGWTIETASE